MSFLYSPLLAGSAELLSTPTTLYWVGGSGTWDTTDATHWAATSGGTGGAGVPTQLTDVVFDSNSGTGTVTVSNSYCKNFSVLTGAPVITFSTSILVIFGDINIQTTNASFTGTGLIYLEGTGGTSTITTSNVTFNCGTLNFNGAGSTWTLQDTLNVSTTATTNLNAGTLNLNGNVLYTGRFTSSNTNTRALTSSTSASVVITQTTTGTVWDTGTPNNFTGSNNITIIVTGNHSVTKTISLGGQSVSNAFNVRIGGNGTTFTFSSNDALRDLVITNTTCTITNTALNIYGSLDIQGTSPTLSAGPNTWTFSQSGTKTITTNGKTLEFSIVISSIGGTIQLLDNLTITAARTVNLSNGTLDLNGNTLSSGAGFTVGSGTKNITFNGGTLLCPAASTTAFYNLNPTNFTTTAGTGVGKISMTASTAKTFVGGGSTYNCTLENAGAGALTISGNNTFTTISNSVQPTTFTFTSGTTQTVTNFSVSGTSGSQVTINSTTSGSPATLSKSTGTVSVSYCTIKDISATGGATWLAYTSSGNVDNTGNSGWLFAAATAGYIKIYMGSGPGWVYKPVKEWNGTQWVIKPVKWYDTSTSTWKTTSGT